MLAAFLNAKLFGNFKGKKEDKFKQAKAAPVRSELQIARVDVPTGLPKTTLRDALLQYRLRHTQHPHEAEAVDWILGQLDPAFELIAVKVPEQTRLLILEAIIQHVQQHAGEPTVRQPPARRGDARIAARDSAPPRDHATARSGYEFE